MSNSCRLLIGKGSTWAYAIMSGILAFVPEEVFKYGFIPCEWPDVAIVIVNRILLFLLIFALSNIIYYCYRSFRRSVSLSDRTTEIQVRYGDICKIRKGIKVINFDECYSTTVGTRPAEIKPDSVCGQYLKKYPIEDIQPLLDQAGIKPKGKSEFGDKDSFEPGILLPRNDFYLMAFAKLDKDGRGFHTYESYLRCLDKLWEQIDLYHGTEDVYIPILGSRITRFEKEFTQQELLDIMIASYRLHPRKLRKPNTLHIICKEREGFSLNDIFGVD